MEDLRTEAEKRYDAERDGSFYEKAAAQLSVWATQRQQREDDDIKLRVLQEEQARRQAAARLLEDENAVGAWIDDRAGGAAYIKPEASAAQRAAQFAAGCQAGRALAGLINQDADDDPAIAAWIDTYLPADADDAPAMLDAATARQQALSTWKGEVKTHANGNTLRYPALEEVEIGQLADGTPIYGEFDNDDKPLVVVADWESFSIVAGGGGVNLIDTTDETGREYDHITLAQWERLKALVQSGVVDQALHFAKVWHAQRAA